MPLVSTIAQMLERRAGVQAHAPRLCGYGMLYVPPSR